jgi:hypothetical protein
MDKSAMLPKDLGPTSAGRSAYEKPTLFRYGTLRDITLAQGDMGSADGGSGMNDKSKV